MLFNDNVRYHFVMFLLSLKQGYVLIGLAIASPIIYNN